LVLIIKRKYADAFLTDGDQVHPLIFQALDMGDFGGTTDMEWLCQRPQRFHAVTDQHYTKRSLFSEAQINHLFVTVFKDMQIERGAREKNCVQWEEWNFKHFYESAI
jgi:hypothetical protein